MPELPRVYLNTDYVVPTGAVIRVAAGGNLQGAIDAAACGDRILLAAGATYTGNYRLRNKGCTTWTEISTETPLPADGVRVSLASAASYAHLRTPGGNVPTLMADNGAGFYRILGVTIDAPATVTALGALVEFHTDPLTAVSQLAHDIILDRVVIQGHDLLQLRRCALLNAVRVAVIDSYLTGCHATGSDSQAILFWDTPGPIKVVNNYLEGAGENLMIGGADPKLLGVVPADIEIRGNHFFKPLAWKTSGAWTIKNLLELKIGKRVLIEGNVLENIWPAGQTGFAVVIKSVNQSNTAPWSETSDVTMRGNVIRNAAHGIDLSSHPEPYPVVPGSRMAILQNLILLTPGSSSSRGLMMDAGLVGVTIGNNTVLGPGGAALLLYGTKTVGTLTLQNNLLETWIKSADGLGWGIYALNGHLNAWTVLGNLFVISYNNVIAEHPPGNRYVFTVGGIGFVDVAGGNYRLSTSSAFRGIGTDGKDPGVDWDALVYGTRGSVTGVWP
jgi:hypothetical protein